MAYKRKIIIIFSGLIITFASLILFVESMGNNTSSENSIILFQKITGGLGMGAVTSPSYNLIDFDPRIQDVDDSITWPVPGMYSYGAHRCSTICYFEEIPVNHLRIIKTEAKN